MPGGRDRMLNLTTAEQAWLDQYRRELRECFPGNVEDVRYFRLESPGRRPS